MSNYTPGRNLLRATSDLRAVSRWNGNMTVEKTSEGRKFTFLSSGTHAIRFPLVCDNAFESGDRLTLSFYYRGTLPRINTIYLMNHSAGSNVAFGTNITLVPSETEWQRLEYSFQCPDYGSRTIYELMFPYINVDAWLEIKDKSLKLEFGTEATPWRPAPEDDDYDSLISEGGWNR